MTTDQNIALIELLLQYSMDIESMVIEDTETGKRVELTLILTERDDEIVMQ